MTNFQKILKNILVQSTGEVLLRGINLLVYAYLARTILPTGFGKISFASAFVSFFIIFTGFGLDTISQRNVARNPEKLVHHLSTTIILKLIFGSVSFISLMLVVWCSSFDAVTERIAIIFGLTIFLLFFRSTGFTEGEKMQYQL